MQEENNHISFTAEDIRKYHEGRLTPAQRHALERASLEDPFLADALEGYATDQARLPGDIDELKHRLQKRVEEKKVVPIAGTSHRFNWLRAAAMVIAIAGAGLLVYNLGFNNKENNIAQERSAKQQESLRTTDTSAMTGNNSTATGPGMETLTNEDNITPGKTDPEKKKQPAAGTGTAALSDSPSAITEEAAKAKEAAPKMPSATPAKDDQLTALQTGRSAGIVASQDGNSQELMKLKAHTDSLSEAKRFSAKAEKNYAATALNNSQQLERNTHAPRAKRSQSPLQSLNIFRGQVTDEQNNPLPFANITNNSDQVGTYADAQGNFVLTSPDSILNVQVRSLGFENNITQLQNGLSLNRVTLKDDNSIPPIVLNNKQVNARQRQNNMVLEEPEPADGWTKYDAYLANNLKLPDTYQVKPQDRSEVELSFEINQLGEPINIKVEKSLCEICDKEAIRLLKDGPKWKRKARKGKRTTITIPF